MRAEIRNNIKFPKLTFQNDLVYVAERIIIPIMVDNINKSKALDGTALPDLSEKTIKRKGHAKPLIDTRKLIQSFIFKKKGKHGVLITIKKERKNIGEYLQIDGVGKKKKRFNFFGISTAMERAAMRYMEKRIKKAVRSA